ncbi:MAG: uracil-DNA glycosylase family protein [Rectinemataceae bacterium]
MFTGDRSGDWLFASLHRVGLASRPTSTHRDDGQSLDRVRITAAVHCAPPDNKPTREEFAACADWLTQEWRLVEPSARVIVALGGLAWDAVLRMLRASGGAVPRPRPSFGHGARASITTAAGHEITVLGSYHPSQQNTFTGRLTEPMLDEVLRSAARAAVSLTTLARRSRASSTDSWSLSP